MEANGIVTLLSALVALGGANTPANAALPGDVLIQYNIREIPTQTLSDVVFNVAIDMTAVAEDGNEIAWFPTAITITRYQGQEGETVWMTDAPAFDTVDGYWWVEHADIADPRSEEFHMPPYMTGIAEAGDSGVQELEYELRGVTCNAECQAMFGGHVAAVDHRFRLVNQSRPLEEGEDEPVEIPEGETP